jgi:hypothetical protein
MTDKGSKVEVRSLTNKQLIITIIGMFVIMGTMISVLGTIQQE